MAELAVEVEEGVISEAELGDTTGEDVCVGRYVLLITVTGGEEDLPVEMSPMESFRTNLLRWIQTRLEPAQ